MCSNILLLLSLALLEVNAFSSSSDSSSSATSFFVMSSAELSTSTKMEERRGSREEVSRGNNRGREGGGIQIVGLPGGQVQSLPQIMYVGAFRRWIGNSVTTDDDNDSDNDSDDTRIKSTEAIPGAGGHDKTAGWVDPTTTK